MAIKRKEAATTTALLDEEVPVEERSLPTSLPASREPTDTTTTLSPQKDASVGTAPNTTATPTKEGNPRNPSIHDVSYHMASLMKIFDDTAEREKASKNSTLKNLLLNIGEAGSRNATAWGAPDSSGFYANLRKQLSAPLDALDAEKKRKQSLFSLATGERGYETELEQLKAAQEASAARAAQSQANADRTFGLSAAELERKKAADAALEEYRKARLAARGKGKGGGTLTKKGDIGIEIEVPPREEFWGSDGEYNNMVKLSKSKSPADRDKAFKYLEASDNRKLQHTPDPTKLAEAEVSGDQLKELLSTVKNGEIPGLGSSVAERLALTNTGIGMIDKAAHNIGFGFMPTEQQDNFTKFQTAANQHIKAMAGAGVTNSELERAMTAAGAANPFTDPKVRTNIIKAWEKDNEILRKKLNENPFMRLSKASASSSPAAGVTKFPVKVLATNDNTIHKIKNQADLEEALADQSDPIVIIGSE